MGEYVLILLRRSDSLVVGLGGNKLPEDIIDARPQYGAVPFKEQRRSGRGSENSPYPAHVRGMYLAPSHPTKSKLTVVDSWHI